MCCVGWRTRVSSFSLEAMDREDRRQRGEKKPPCQSLSMPRRGLLGTQRVPSGGGGTASLTRGLGGASLLLEKRRTRWKCHLKTNAWNLQGKVAGSRTTSTRETHRVAPREPARKRGREPSSLESDGQREQRAWCAEVSILRTPPE